jgi:hypothetical protein
MTDAIDAIRAATRLSPHDTASFALMLRPDQRPSTVAQAVEAAFSPVAAKVEPLSALDQRVLVLRLPGRVFGTDDAATFAAAYALADELDIEEAEPNLPTEFFPEQPPSGGAQDPVRDLPEGFPRGCWSPGQPELDNDPLWALDIMRVPQAWALSQSQQRPGRGLGIVVAQPDTGITVHAELEGVATVPGFDILSGDTDPTDPLNQDGNPGHGTGTGSVLVSPETKVVSGTAPLASHMPIRAITSVVQVTQVSVARAIDWAVDHGAHVITMSLGGLPSFSLHRALRRAVAANVVVLAAAGNCVRFVVWPARYDECVAVAGTNSSDRPWRGTCRGAAVDISAPAQNVLRASVDSGPGGSATGQGQGTSYAVALTAGVAALWLAHHGRDNLLAAARSHGETLQQMFLRLVRATARRPAGWDDSEMGAGVVDARALLDADPNLTFDDEAAPLRADAPASGPDTMRSLVAEAVGPAAMQDQVLDWHRFGPEIATALLRAQLGSSQQDEATAAPPIISDRLAAQITNPALREWFGLGGERRRG